MELLEYWKIIRKRLWLIVLLLVQSPRSVRLTAAGTSSGTLIV